MRKFVVCLTFLGLLSMCSYVHGYEEDVHFILTKFLAESAGFRSDDTDLIARFDQATDDDPSTSPMPVTDWLDPLAITHRAQYHFVSITRLLTMEELAITTCDQKAVGQYLHALQDSYSHKNFEPALGHVHYGHTPNKTYKDPGKAASMASRVFYELVRLGEKCRSGIKPLRRWVEISDQVGNFLKAPPPSDSGLRKGWNTNRGRLKMLVSEATASYERAWQEYQEWKKKQGW